MDGSVPAAMIGAMSTDIQSPVGDGCTAEFDRISLTDTRLDDQFDGG